MARDGMRVTLLGLERLQAKVRRLPPAARTGIAAALNEVAKDVFIESQHKVPVDTGNLKGSGRVNPATPERLTAGVTYGGTAAAYALAVHETHATKGKYLEEPARSASGQFAEEVGRAIQEAVRRV